MAASPRVGLPIERGTVRVALGHQMKMRLHLRPMRERAVTFVSFDRWGRHTGAHDRHIMRILVTDDDLVLLVLVRRLLKSEGHAVDIAGTCDEARALATSRSYDAMVLDLELPDGNSISLIGELRSAGVNAPVLMLTATDDAPTTVRALDAGADDYLTKPFDPAELAARVRALGRRRSSGAVMDRLSAGNVVFSRIGRTVTVGEKAVRLTVKQLAILEQLLMANGEVVGREPLLEQSFGLTIDPGTNVLDVNVWRLRRALKSAGADVSIEARRGIGFALVV